ncbi:hypothetical protein D3C83_126380 [compost metagenome]
MDVDGFGVSGAHRRQRDEAAQERRLEVHERADRIVGRDLDEPVRRVRQRRRERHRLGDQIGERARAVARAQAEGRA